MFTIYRTWFLIGIYLYSLRVNFGILGTKTSSPQLQVSCDVEWKVLNYDFRYGAIAAHNERFQTDKSKGTIKLLFSSSKLLIPSLNMEPLFQTLNCPTCQQRLGISKDPSSCWHKFHKLVTYVAFISVRLLLHFIPLAVIGHGSK